MLVLGHLGLALLGGRLARGLFSSLERFPMSWLLLGAMLPDLVDKPLGHALLGWDNGRLWGHTLAFVLAFGALAWVLASSRLAVLTLGSGLHQGLDQLPWSDVSTWLWPLAGGFPRGVSSGVPDWIHALLRDPIVWTTEALGLVCLLGLLALPLFGLAPRWWQPVPSPQGGPTGGSLDVAGTSSEGEAEG